MKELDAIVAEVKVALAAKQQEINNADCSVISYVKDIFKFRELEVFSFEQSAYDVATDHTQKSKTIEKFRNDAKELLAEISKIKV